VSIPLESYRHCEALARRSGSNFVLAFLTLPRPMRRDMCALYAFMRHTDDLGDAPELPGEQSRGTRKERLLRWRDELAASLQGEPVTSAILPALADVVRRHAISQDYLFEVVDGVIGDLTSRSFRTFEELERYCFQVAGAVGLCCLHVWGLREGDNMTDEDRQRGIACGTAFQLTNILRDLGEDARQGRIYLPVEDLDRFGYPSEALREQSIDPAFRSLMQFEVERAWSFYREAAPLLERLPPEGRRILSTFVEVYSTLLREIERRDYDVFSSRVRLPRWKKASVVLRCLLGGRVTPNVASPDAGPERGS
jgi:15-cis-phytoene synthase